MMEIINTIALSYRTSPGEQCSKEAYFLTFLSPHSVSINLAGCFTWFSPSQDMKKV
jgi:hypothetical protein